MQFIDDGVFPWTSAPLVIFPIEGTRINDFTRPVHIERLESGSRVGNLRLAIDLKSIAAACAGSSRYQFEPTIIEPFKRELLCRRILNAEFNALGLRAGRSWLAPSRFRSTRIASERA